MKVKLEKLFIHFSAHMLRNNFEENRVLLLKYDEYMHVNLALDCVLRKDGHEHRALGHWWTLFPWFPRLLGFPCFLSKSALNLSLGDLHTFARWFSVM